jgi:hypothetical protein
MLEWRWIDDNSFNIFKISALWNWINESECLDVDNNNGFNNSDDDNEFEY